MNSKRIGGQKLGIEPSTDMVRPTGPVGTIEVAAQTPAAQRSIDRRSFLRAAGLGVGTVAVAGVSGLTWRAVDGGVFATGTGPAYAAWDQASPSGQSATGMVRAAVLAANAHNTQPWHFTVAKDRIDLFADTSRNIGAMDPLGREMQISLGCAIENLALAGPVNGKTPTVTLMPDPADGTHIARVDVVPVHRSASALFGAIPIRHTNRAAYDTRRPVTRRQLDGLGSLVDAPDTELVWFTRANDKRAFGDLTIRATQAIIADPQQAADDFAWYRTDWHEIQTRKDGITIDASGQPPLIRTLAKVLPVSRQQNNDGWLRGTRDTQIPTAAAFGALVVRDPLDPIQRLRVGRIWQRIHLWATANGLALQPLCQILERIDRERSAQLPGDFTTAMSTMLPARWHPIMTFRIGYPTGDALRSPRRPAADVVLT
jgi:nitroreductase